MKDVNGKILYRGKEYGLVFNLNVMEDIQSEYGSIAEWGAKTDGENGEPDAKAVKYGITAMLNEWIDIQNEETGDAMPFLSEKQVGRMISEMGFANTVQALNNTVIDSTQSTEKNE